MSGDWRTRSLSVYYFGAQVLRSDRGRRMAASSRAYRDMSRTLRLRAVLDSDRALRVRHQVQKVMADVIDVLPPITSQEDFDRRHRDWRRMLVRFYEDEGVTMSHGQAQKWINMTAKYLFVLNDDCTNKVAGFLHVPIDSVVAKQAKSQLDLKWPSAVWSKMDSDAYEEYQWLLRGVLSASGFAASPIEWEIEAWLDGMADRLGTG